MKKSWSDLFKDILDGGYYFPSWQSWTSLRRAICFPFNQCWRALLLGVIAGRQDWRWHHCTVDEWNRFRSNNLSLIILLIPFLIVRFSRSSKVNICTFFCPYIASEVTAVPFIMRDLIRFSIYGSCIQLSAWRHMQFTQDKVVLLSATTFPSFFAALLLEKSLFQYTLNGAKKGKQIHAVLISIKESLMIFLPHLKSTEPWNFLNFYHIPNVWRFCLGSGCAHRHQEAALLQTDVTTRFKINCKMALMFGAKCCHL